MTESSHAKGADPNEDLEGYASSGGDSDLSENLFASDNSGDEVEMLRPKPREPASEVAAALVRAVALQEDITLFMANRKIPGLAKLRKCVMKETNHLRRHLEMRTSYHTAVSTSNLPYLEELFNVVKSEKDIISIFKRFRFSDPAFRGKTLSVNTEQTRNGTPVDVEERRAKRAHYCEVDVVSEKGAKWIKVKAQSPLAIQRSCEDRTFRHKNLRNSLRRALDASEAHTYHFVAPKLVVVFSKGVTQAIAKDLRDMGVLIRGRVVANYKLEALRDEDLYHYDDDDAVDELGVGGIQNGASANEEQTRIRTGSDDERKEVVAEVAHEEEVRIEPGSLVEMANDDGEFFKYFKVQQQINPCFLFRDTGSCKYGDKCQFSHDKELMQIKADDNQKKPILNIDVTALVSYCSDMTNGHATVNFCDAFLRRMAKEEKETPSLPIIERYFATHTLVICETARMRFNTLVGTVGGEREVARAERLLKRLKIVPDHPSERSVSLKAGGSLSEENKVVFGTGDSLKATTLTANRSAVRSAASQGVEFSVFFHPARSLTESARQRDQDKQELERIEKAAKEEEDDSTRDG